ncbi:chromate efflux transporter [Bacillus sp. UMB0893]|uniref:chromate efflux transporter n=1 Tax=Bacillus sp. UMB0893 TaxID=2066053 RepID=UPI000C771AA7|nr:chromate efflux transporter [Bacillus sp. UMB0893]PLR67525.1 ChrA protein [Bacillus sp. UMB0893]QNG59817.1 chromate efflux transporter [Bacillus sp. PAMC26568]
MFKTWIEILLVSTKLGLTSFGGPIAHLGYFRDEYVKKRNWLDERSYADLVALCQFLPGPASSQVGISIGIVRGGMVGGFLSWFGFTMPSVIALILFAYFVTGFQAEDAGWINGLKIVAVAVVAQAILGMGKNLTPDRPRISIAVIAAIWALFIPSALGQIAIIVIAGAAGYILYKEREVPKAEKLNLSVSLRTGIIAWILFFGLLIVLPLIRQVFPNMWTAMFDTFYRVGSIVFGGGHVVLPMMEREVVPSGWISEEVFLAGYGAVQAVPGPLFTFASYLGASINGVQGAILATAAMFLPSFLLVLAMLPFWNTLREKRSVQASLMGVNAAVVGILLAAFYNPVWTSAIKTTGDFALALTAFAMLVYWKLPPWIVVLGTAVGGILIQYVE